MKLTRDDLIDYVLTKLDEHSPFDEPQSMIAAADDSSYDKVKPIRMYVENLLDEAANDCLRALPLSLVGKDVERSYSPATIVTNGVGAFPLKDSNGKDITHYIRLVRVRAVGWKREVTSFITSSDPLYLLQQDENARGKKCKPVVALVPEHSRLELYSFDEDNPVNAEVFYIPCNKKAGNDQTNAINSDIDELVGIRCAELICDVFGNQGSQQIFQKEFAEKMNSVIR